MLEDIGNLPKYKTVIEKARSISVFIYSHISTLALMRKFTNRRELVRPGVTRFATSFLSLGCIIDKKMQLASMVSSPDWDENRWSGTVKGRAVKQTIYSDVFWRDAQQLMKIYTLLFKLLRIVDGDKKPSMGFVYGMLQDAKDEIKASCNRKESVYRPILEIIEKKAKDRLDSPLHLAAYYFNPYYYYKDNTIKEDTSVKAALMYCIDKFYPEEYNIHDIIGSKEVQAYKSAAGIMGSGMAERYWKSFNGTDDFNPGMSFYFCLISKHLFKACNIRKLLIVSIFMSSSLVGFLWRRGTLSSKDGN